MNGEQFGQYTIVDVLGRGGMSTVYKAYQPSVERFVALKVLLADVSDDPKLLARFKREARVIANLEHRAIVPMYEFGEWDGLPYIAMRYLDGGTLRKKLYYEYVTLEQTARIIEQVAEALDHGHEQGVIHRDMKPSNIMLDGSGNAYLTDFGIARMLDSTAQITEGNGVVGTPSYMSPEQCRGKELGPASDIYSLGVILFEMATGRTPYKADTPLSVMYMHVRDPIPSVREHDPSLSEELAGVIMKAMAKKPEDRYPTAAALAEAFADAVAKQHTYMANLDGETIPSYAKDPRPDPTDGMPEVDFYIGPPTGEVPRAEYRTPAPTPQPTPASEVVPAIPPQPPQEEDDPNAGMVVSLVVLGLIVALIAGGLIMLSGITQGNPNAAIAPTLPPGLTPTATHTRAAPTEISVGGGDVTDTPTFIPSLTFTPLPTLTPLPTVTPPGGISTATVIVQPTSTFEPTPTPSNTLSPSVTPVIPTATFQPTFTPTFTPTATATLTPTPTATFTPSPTFTATFTPTPESLGGRLVFHRGEAATAEIVVMDDNGTNIQQVTANNIYDGEPDWSPDGQRIVIEFRDIDDVNLYIINADGSGRTQLTDLAGPDGNPDWSGNEVVFENGTNAASEIYVVNVNTNDVTRLTDNAFADRAPQFSPSGDKIAYMTQENGSWQIAVMDYPGGGNREVFDCPAADCRFPAWGPDGSIAYNTLAAPNSGVGTVYRLNPSTGVSTLVTDVPNVGRVAFATAGTLYMNQTVDGVTYIVRYTIATDDLTLIASFTEDAIGPDWTP